jgi:hypothetical protein
MSKLREKFDSVGRFLGGLLVVVVIVFLLGGCFYLDYSAYRQRFPNASWWTYFFRKGE